MKTINLLPSTNQSEAQPSAHRRLMFGVVTALILESLVAGYGFFHVQQLNQRLSQEKATISHQEKELKPTETLQKELAVVLDRQASWDEISQDDSRLYQLLPTIAGATPERLRVTTVTVTKDQEIELHGTAADRDQIARFVTQLQAQRLFEAVNLKQADSQEGGVSFSLTLTFSGGETGEGANEV